MTGTSTTEARGNKVGVNEDVLNQKDKDDHTRLRAEKFRKQAAGAIKNVKKTTEAAIDELPDYIETVSKIVDDKVFEPYFLSNAGLFERNLSDSMTDLRSIRKIDDLLRFTKVFAVISSVFFFSLSLRSCARASPVTALLYGAISADALRISYNCYIKNYCAIAMKKLGSDGNPAKIGAAVFQWAQSALGVSNAEDPFQKLKKEILWDVVFEKCFSLILFKKAKVLLAQMK